MKKILWDKINKRECRHQYFFDQYGDCFINQDQFGANMSSFITISYIGDNHPQYEVKEVQDENTN
jgi:hypothetical protein